MNPRKKLPFTLGSDWSAALSSLPKEITPIIRADLYAFRHLPRGMLEKPNLSKHERKALKELQNKQIFIKPAHKGNAVVLMDREQYIWEGQRQLKAAKHTTPLNEPMYPQTIIEIKEILEEMCKKKFINRKQKKYLLGSGTPRARKCYLLPKIHTDPKN